MSVDRYPAHLLPFLPAPWRLRLAWGPVEFDCTSSTDVEPKGWNRAETWFVMTAALEGRLPRDLGPTAAARLRSPASEAATWATIGGGLDERFLFEVRGSVGEAISAMGAVLVGAWSGDAAEVRGRHGQGGPRGERTLQVLRARKR